MWYKISTHWILLEIQVVRSHWDLLNQNLRGCSPEICGLINHPYDFLRLLKSENNWPPLSYLCTLIIVFVHLQSRWIMKNTYIMNPTIFYNPIPGHLHLSPCPWTTVMACKQVSPPKPTVHSHTAATVILPKEKSDHIFIEWVPMTVNINSYKDISFGCY